MRCLHCGKRLPLLKKLTGGGEFCSEAHRQSYHEEYNRLALSRLLQAQTRPEEHQPRAHPAEPSPEPETSKALWLDSTVMAGLLREAVPPRNARITPVVAGAGDWKNGHADLPGTEPVLVEPALDVAGAVECSGYTAHSVAPQGAGAANARAVEPIVPTGPFSAHPDTAVPEHLPRIVAELRPGWADAVDASGAAMAPALPLDGEPQGPGQCQLPISAVPEFAETLEIPWRSGLPFAPPDEAPEPADCGDAGGCDPPGVPQVAAPAPPDADADVVEAAKVQPAQMQSPETPEPPPDACVVEAQDVPVMETQSPAIERSAAPEIAVPTAPKAEEPARTGRWLPVAVKPAPMTNKPRLMQSFQAIALIRPAPQLPSFDVLPLRPKMGFSGAPRQNGGPARNGTTGQPDSGFAGSAPEPSEELPVPSFAMQNAATGRSAARKLARWLNISHRSTDE